MGHQMKICPTETPKSERTIEGKCNSIQHLNRALMPLLKWMSSLGILPAVDSLAPVCSIRTLPSVIIFLLVSSTQFFLAVSKCVDAKSETNMFAHKFSTNAISWNIIIDTVNMAIYTIVNTGFLLGLTKTKLWTNLVDSFEMAPKNPSFDIYSKSRKTQIYLMILVVISVSI